MEFSRSFPSVTFAVLTVDQSVKHGVEPICCQQSRVATLLKEMAHFL